MPQDIDRLPSLLNSASWFIADLLGKSYVEVDALSRIPWDQSIGAEVVEAIFKSFVYACHEKAISSLILESPSVWMTIVDWVQAQKVDQTINQVIMWMENKKLETAKMGEEMSHELKQYLRQRGEAVFVRRDSVPAY